LYTATGRPLILKTPLGPDALLVVGLHAREAVSELFSVRLELVADPSADVPFERLLGHPASVTLEVGEQRPRYLHGVISRLEEGDADEDFLHFEAELVPSFWLWTKRVQSRVFQQVSVPEILNNVLKGLDVAIQLTRLYPPREYCVQYRESDFAFASRLMEEEGIYYYFRHTSDGHTLVIADAPPTVEEASGVAYQPDRTAKHAQAVWSWRKAQVVTPSKWALRDYSFELPDQHLEATAQLSEEASAGTIKHRLRGGFNDDLEIFDGLGGYSWHADNVGFDGADHAADLARLFDEAQTQARLRMEEAGARALEVHGHGTCPWFTPGTNFELTRHRNAAGKYFLTRVEHEATQSGFRSGDEPSFQYQNRFGCIPAKTCFRPQRSTPRPIVAGTQTAVVVGPAGLNTFVDKYGREGTVSLGSARTEERALLVLVAGRADLGWQALGRVLLAASRP
jgi:type VI secretion system secreted protein VgrG